MIKSLCNILDKCNAEKELFSAWPGSCPDRPASSEFETAICRMALKSPNLSHYVVSSRLRETGIVISPATVYRVWKRYGLETSIKRVKALAIDIIAAQRSHPLAADGGEG